MAELQVTVLDPETGQSETRMVPDNDVLVITTGTCEITNVQDYPTKGTQIYTIKGRGGRRA